MRKGDWKRKRKGKRNGQDEVGENEDGVVKPMEDGLQRKYDIVSASAAGYGRWQEREDTHRNEKNGEEHERKRHSEHTTEQ